MKWKVFLLLVCLAGCEMSGSRSDGTGELRIAFSSLSDEFTRASSEYPDTSNYLLTIEDSKGRVVYDGQFGDCPESLSVPAGNYTIRAVSSKFEKPAFSAPQYGDEQCVIVPDGAVVDVRLVCRQTNSGVRLRIAKDFLTQCSDGVLYLKSDAGKLMYGYSEKRIAYFLPGRVSLVLAMNGNDEVLMTRTLLAQEVLSLGVSVASAGNSGSVQPSGRISIEVDTLRYWISDAYVIGGGSHAGEGIDDAMTVLQAQASVGTKDVWVCGYIVGGDLTSSSASFEEPFSSRTNILLGPKSSTSDKSACLSVQLPSGSLRDVLNLVDNPHLLGRKVYLKGDVVDAYYGIPGIKNVSEYKLL